MERLLERSGRWILLLCVGGLVLGLTGCLGTGSERWRLRVEAFPDRPQVAVPIVCP